MRRFLTIIFVSLSLAGCASLSERIFGVPADRIDTANKAMLAAAVQIESIADLTTGLLRAGTINADQAARVRDKLQPALDGVRTAQEAVAQSGDPSQAESAINAARSAIEIALSLLSAFTGEDVASQWGLDHAFFIAHHRGRIERPFDSLQLAG